MEIDESPLAISCLLPKTFAFGIRRADLCDALRQVAGRELVVTESDTDHPPVPGHAYLLSEESLDWYAATLTTDQRTRLFSLGGAKGPVLNRFLEEHQMPGGYRALEWFKVRSLETERYPTLRIEVADELGFERVNGFASDHYAQYDPGLGLSQLLVRYLTAYDRWRLRGKQ